MLAPYTPNKLGHEAYIKMQTAAKATGLTLIQLARANGFSNVYDWQRKIMNDIEIEEGMKAYFERTNRCDQEEEDLH